MSKKILICEDDQMFAGALAKIIDEAGNKPTRFVDSPESLSKNITKKLEEINPDYVLIDGLHGQWKQIEEKVKQYNPSIVSIIYSGLYDLVEHARREGYVAFEKCSETSKLIDYLRDIK